MSAIQNNTFPSAIREKLQRVRWRSAGLAACRAAIISAVVLLTGMVLAMSIDWWFPSLSTTLRLAMTTAVLFATIATLAFLGLRPVVSALGWKTAAECVDTRIPQLEERWTTVASFARSSWQPRTATEKAMLQQVTSEAVAMGTLVRPHQVVRSVPLKQPGVVLAVATVCFAGFLAINWGQTSILLQRFWQPTVDITATQLLAVSGDAVIPRGTSVELVVRQTGLARDTALLTIEGESFLNERLELRAENDNPDQFLSVIDVDETFRYQVTAGDGRTEWHQVTAVDYPLLSEVELVVTPPEYVHQDPVEKTLIPGRLRVVQGSTLTIAMRSAEPLERFELRLSADNKESSDDDSQPDSSSDEILVLMPDKDGWYHFETPLVEDFSFSPWLQNVHGLENEERRVCRVHVVADKAPVARLITPTDEMAVSPDEEIEIKFEAHDDHGIASAQLVIYSDTAAEDGEEPTILAVKEIPLGDQKLKKHVMASTQLDLKELGLKEGENISYSVRVTDNRDVSPEATEIAQQAMASTETQSSVAPEDESQTTKAESDLAGNEGQNHTDQNTVAAEREDQQSDGSSPGENQPSSQQAMLDKTDRAAQDIAAQIIADSEAQPNTASDPSSAAVSEQDRSQTSDNPAESRDVPPAENVADADSSNPATRESGQQRLVAATDETSDSAKGDGAEKQLENASETDSDMQDSSLKQQGSSSDIAQQDGKPQMKVASSEQSAADVSNPNDDESARESTDGETTDANGTRIDKSRMQVTDNDNAPSQPKSNNAGDASADPKSPGDNDSNRNESSPAVAQQDSPEQRSAAAMNDSSSRDEAEARQSGGKGKRKSNQSPFQPLVRLKAQSSEQGQRQETNRRRLRITERLAALATAAKERQVNGAIRERVIQIDEMLAEIEERLILLIDRSVPDAQRSDLYRTLDEQLGNVETYIADLRNESKDTKFAFVGLQMVDIGRTHVTPARDRTFAAIREPDIAADVHAKEALHHVVSARELLDALLKKYDRVQQDQQLAKNLDEAVKIYEVYIEKAHQLMREARQNRNPLKRKMAVIEVDQAYLDRYAEVLTLRREMMAEFSRILADDPRLLARYMDLIKRRRSSLRDQLSELFEHQDAVAQEVSGWLQVDDVQRESLWMLVSELRLQGVSDLAKDAQAQAERIQKQMPLVLDASRGTAALVIQHSQQAALYARESSRDAKNVLKAFGDPDAEIRLLPNVRKAVTELSELAAALDQLNFESEDLEGVTDYVNARAIEVRTLADQVDSWSEAAEAIENHAFHQLTLVDQHQLTIATELLRVDMLSIEDDLQGEFQDVDIPQEVRNLSRELNRVMEAITFNQSAASFALVNNNIQRASEQQQKALAKFERAEQLFDRLRRKTIEVLDEDETVQDPNIADLEDPTLDRFLAQLEREPNIEAQLGIPRRPRNLRTIADSMTWQQDGGGMLGSSSDAASSRALRNMKAKLKRPQGESQSAADADREMSEEERRQLAEAKDMQAMLQKKMEQNLRELQQRASAEQTPEEERRRLNEQAEQLQRTISQLNNGQIPEDAWDKLAESDEVAGMLKAMARGEAVSDNQWNKLMSTLDDGLWQVQARNPPQDYRKAIEQYQDSIRRLTTIGADNE